MKQARTLFACAVLLLLLAGCVFTLPEIVPETPTAAPAAAESATAEAATLPETPTEAPTEAPVAAVPTAAAAPATAVPTESPVAERTAANCVLCHTDKELLIAVAAPLEEPEDALSSGVG